MKMTTKSIYAIKSLAFLHSSNAANKPVGIMKLASDMKISNKYLEQIFSRLKDAGWVASSRGATGGYKLIKSADKITVKDIVIHMDGPMEPENCVKNKKCTSCATCSIFWIINEVRDVNEKLLDSITIEQICALKAPFKGCED